MGLFDTSYGDVSRGTFTTSIKGRGARNPPLTIWDAIDAANLSQIPGISDAASLALAGRDVFRGDYGSAGLNGLGALPFIPALGGIIKDIPPPLWNATRSSVPVADWTDEQRIVVQELRKLFSDEQANRQLRALKNKKTSRVDYAWPSDAALHGDIEYQFGLDPRSYEAMFLNR